MSNEHAVQRSAMLVGPFRYRPFLSLCGIRSNDHVIAPPGSLAYSGFTSRLHLSVAIKHSQQAGISTMGMLVNILLTSLVSVITSPTDSIRASMPVTTGHAHRAQTTLTVVMMPCQDFQGITAFLLALSGIDRQDRFTIFSEILDLSIPIARSRADFAGKHPCAPAIDASSPSLAIDSFA